MSNHAIDLPDDPAVLKAVITALQAENARIGSENAKMVVTLRVHDQLVQALRLRIAKLQKLAFGKSSEKIEREIEQLELALEDLLVAVAEGDDDLIYEGMTEPAADEGSAPTLRRRPRVSDATLRERRELDPGTCCADCGGDLRVAGEDVSELLDTRSTGWMNYSHGIGRRWLCKIARLHNRGLNRAVTTGTLAGRSL
jgi:transposase